MTATALAQTTRPAQPADNAALVALAAACPMQAGLTICVHRDPDFFALNRLEGDRWEVGVVDGPDGAVVGCIGVAVRHAYIGGRATRTGYVGDLKVHPAHRGRGLADALCLHARAFCAELGEDAPSLITALAGNRPLERRIPGPRGLPRLTGFATVRSYAVPLLLPPRSLGTAGLTVRRAEARDLDEMAALWQVVAPQRQFAPVQDAGDLARWVATTPGLSIGSYWLAQSAVTGRLAGFVALWDQESFKRTHVLRYGARLAALRLLVNAAAPLVSAPRLPTAGAPLRHVAAYQVAVRSTEPDVLHALLRAAYAELRGSEYVFFTIGLDLRDPLRRALDGFFAVPTDLHAYVTTPAGWYSGPRLDDRPLHFETALV